MMYPAPALLSSLLRRTLQLYNITVQCICALFFILSLLMFSGINNNVFAQKTSDKTEMEVERQKLQLELKQIQQAYDAVKGESKNNLHQLAALNKKIEVQEKYIRNIGKEIKLIDDDIYFSAIEIKRLKKQMDTLKSQYARTVVYAYKNRSNYDYLNFIFSANNFNDAMKRVAYLKNYRNYREKQMEDIVKTNSLIDKRYAHQVASKQKKEGALVTRTGEFSVLEMQVTEKDSVAKLLQSHAGSLQKQIAKKQQEDKQLRSNIASVIRKEIADAKKIAQEELRQKAEVEAKVRREAWAREYAIDNEKSLAAAKENSAPQPTESNVPEKKVTEPPPVTASREPKFDPVVTEKIGNVRAVPKNDNSIVANTGSISARKNIPPPSKTVAENKVPEGGYLNYKADDIALNSDFSQNKGKLPAPVNGVITLGFGRYKIEGVGPEIVGDNPGVTYTANVGAPVNAVFGGEVVSVSKVGGTSFVVLRHGKYFTAYSNLATVTISKGTSVTRGQAIGTVGTDEETGAGKLDFILMIEQKNIDPRSWLR